MIRITKGKPDRAGGEKNVMIYRNKLFSRVSAAYPQSSTLSPEHLRHRGIAMAWVVIVIFALFLLVGLSLDVAKLCLVNHQMHNAADAAALAGAVIVKINPLEARLRAQMIAAENFADHDPVLLDLNLGNLPDGDIIIGQYGYDRDLGIMVFVPDDPAAPGPVNALAVIATRTEARMDVGGPVPLNFGSLVGVDTADLAGTWQVKAGPYAIAVTIGGTGAGLICIRYDYTGLELGGTSFLNVNSTTGNVNDGAIQVNSFDDTGLYTNGGPNIDALALNMCADDCVSKGNLVIDPDTSINFGQPPIPDPLISLPPPATPWTEVTTAYDRLTGEEITGFITPGSPTTVSTGQDVVFPPGYYPDGWRITGGQVTLESGIYILGGYSSGQKSGLYINGGNLDASALTTGGGDPNQGGVMFYITDDGVVDIGGVGYVCADPMSEERSAALGVPCYEGITIFVDRDSPNPSIIRGTSNLDLNGTLYFPQFIDHDYSGNGQQRYALELDGTGDGFGNQVIADSVYIPGTADVTINYDGRNRAPATKSYLVE